MHWQYTPYVIPPLIAAITSLVLGISAWMRRPAPGARAFVLLCLGLAQWSFWNALEVAGTTLETKVFCSRMEYIGIVLIPIGWLIFALAYTGRERWLRPGFLLALSVIPALTVALVWTNDAHHLIWQSLALNTLGPIPVFAPEYAWPFWVHVAYDYLLLALGFYLLFRSLLRAPQLYRGQIGALLIAGLAPIVGNVVFLAGLSPWPLDLAPYAFTITGLAVAWGFFRFRLLDVVPVARDMVVESMADGVIVLDTQNRIVDVNPAAARIIGSLEADLIGQPAREVFAGLPELVARYHHVAELQETLRLPGAAAETADYYDLRISPLRNRRGQSLGRLLLLRDVSQQKRAEAELRKLSQAIEQSPSTVVITNMHGEIEYVNSKFTHLTGYTLAEVQGQTPRLLKTDSVPTEFYEQLWQVLGQGEMWRGEFLNRKKNGDLYWELASISPICDEAGNATHYVKVAEDITDRKNVEAALEQRTAELQARNQELDAFAHTVAHDLKTPLTAIIGFGELLENKFDYLPRERVLSFIRSVNQGSHKMHAIINELLLLASVREIKDIKLAPLDMAYLVEESRRRLAYMIRQSEAELDIPDVWPSALGYGPWIEEVWVNYISNAIKYGGLPPRIILGGEVVADTGMVRFWVRDNGAGLTAEEQTRLFAPFSRLNDGDLAGHGLGLSIVRRIVERLNGRVGVESELEQGSCFYFELPPVEA